jgi:hypothetical protein
MDDYGRHDVATLMKAGIRHEVTHGFLNEMDLDLSRGSHALHPLSLYKK